MIPTTIGARNAKASGTNRLVRNCTATSISTPDTTVRYPPFISPVLTVTISAGISFGAGMKFKKPFSPNSKNISPSRIRAMCGKNLVNDFFSELPVPAFVSIYFSFVNSSIPQLFNSSTFSHPPAIAPTIKNGSSPLTIASGRRVSGGSSDKSSWHAKNLTNGRRFSVTWSRTVPRSTGYFVFPGHPAPNPP